MPYCLFYSYRKLSIEIVRSIIQKRLTDYFGAGFVITRKRAHTHEKGSMMDLAPNTVRLTVRGEPVEPPATHPEPFDKLRVNGGLLSEQQWVSPANTVDAPIEGRALGINEESAASQSMLARL